MKGLVTNKLLVKHVTYSECHIWLNSIVGDSRIMKIRHAGQKMAEKIQTVFRQVSKLSNSVEMHV